MVFRRLHASINSDNITSIVLQHVTQLKSVFYDIVVITSRQSKLSSLLVARDKFWRALSVRG